VSRPAIDFLFYLLRRRAARTRLTVAESRLLTTLARGRGCVVEVGVYQGATSARLAAAMAPAVCLWLVDPYRRETRWERLLGFSANQHVARRSVRPWADRVRFLRRTGAAAARELAFDRQPELIFIDADHSYDAVREDFLAWAPHLAPQGVLALHDSRMCPARPDLDAATGPVRLAAEILGGVHGDWSLAAEADSVAAFQRGDAR
jgi:predicted O-methyltransferase YrrM